MWHAHDRQEHCHAAGTRCVYVIFDFYYQFALLFLSPALLVSLLILLAIVGTTKWAFNKKIVAHISAPLIKLIFDYILIIKSFVSACPRDGTSFTSDYMLEF